MKGTHDIYDRDISSDRGAGLYNSTMLDEMTVGGSTQKSPTVSSISGGISMIDIIVSSLKNV